MNPERLRLPARFELIVTVFSWLALAIAIGLSVAEIDATNRMVAAAVASGAWVVALHAVPGAAQERRWVGELLAVAGVTATLLSVGISGRIDSPYLIVTLAPTLYASARLGTRVGLETATLSVAGLVVIAILLEDSSSAGALAITAAVHVVVAATFAQVRRTYTRAVAESEELRRTSAETEIQLQRLQAANDLLLRFAGLLDAGELNPVTTGREALRRLEGLVAHDAALVAVAGDDGPLVVARSGDETVPHHRTTFPLAARGREVGFVVLARPAPFTDAERDAIMEALRPVELAFSNVLLLRDIARRAVREERTRLARDLHDEIGPSLASLGLALDLAVLEYATEPGLTRHLEDLRASVGTLVDDIRRTVTDLRAGDQATLTERLRAIVADLPPHSPRVSLSIDERRPPRPTLLDDLVAIVSEALRNVVRHAGARSVAIEGFVDRGDGKLVVRDDGAGFDTAAVFADRYGILGMEERAGRIGGSVQVESSPGVGTTVTLEWGPA